MEVNIHVPKTLLAVLNQIHEIEQKISTLEDPGHLLRNLDRVREALGEKQLPLAESNGETIHIGLVYERPQMTEFRETRTDVEATISGHGQGRLMIVDVIKPIIRVVYQDGDQERNKIIQKGIVIVEAEKEADANE